MFENAKLKIGRANEHLEALKDSISAWSDTNPYSLVRQCNADATRYNLVVRIDSEPPFDQWSLIAGDCIHNLRSALDHLVYAVVVHEAKGNPPADPRFLNFPIADEPDNFIGPAQGIRFLSDPVKTEIERLQPYNRPHKELPPLLSVLRDFNNSDKHRLLNIAIAIPVKGEFNNIRNLIPDQIVRIEAHASSVQNGTEIASITLDRPTPNVQYDFCADLTITVKHAHGPTGRELVQVTHVLALMRDEVEHVITRMSGVVGL